MNIDIVQAVLAGLVVGLGLALLIVKMRGGNGSAAIKKLEEEHEKYRKEVDSHFVKTAGLFKGLTDQYRDVYKHMAEGAGTLCSDEVKTLQSDLAATGLLTQEESVVTNAGNEEVKTAPEQPVTEEVTTSEAARAEVQPAKDHVEVVAEKPVEEKSQSELEKPAEEKKEETEQSTKEDDFPLASEVEIPSELAEEKKK